MHENDIRELLEDHGISAELVVGPSLDRRQFLTALGGGIVVLLTLGCAEGRTQDRGTIGLQPREPEQIWGWLQIGQDGTITGYVGKVELGQNARTTLTLVVAEELGVGPRDVELVMADTSLTPFDMGTFGSRTTPYTVPPLRRAAAAARELLLDLAAEKLQVGRDTLVLDGGAVKDPASGKTLGFGALTEGKALMQTVPDNVPTIAPSDWRVVGRPTPKVDGELIVTGRRKYASDIKRPNMLQGKVLRGPALRARPTSVDTHDAEATPGVVVCHEDDFIAVAAPTVEEAEKALSSIKAEWERTPQISNAELFDHLRKTARNAERGGHAQGSVPDGLAQADHVVAQSYTLEFISHAAIEPRSAVAEWEGDNLTVWAATQAPFGVRRGLAGAFGLPERQITVIAPDTGNGYGGKTNNQAAVEAARLARAAGRPVRVAWTRQEEIVWNYFRPAGVIEITSGVRKDGTLTAWRYGNFNSGSAALETPYDVPNQDLVLFGCDNPLPQGAYRGLAAPGNIWARETHMDEIAEAVGMDPLEFRLHNLSNERLRAVLAAAAERFGWGTAPAGEGRGVGIACGADKGGYTCSCAQVHVDPNTRAVKVERIVTAFECGAVINPLQLENQIQGAAIMALGGALFEAIEFADGEIKNATFSTYRVPQFSDRPVIECVLVDRKDLPSSGAGETPFAGIAPSVGNAIHQATGVRLRSLPMAPQGVPV